MNDQAVQELREPALFVIRHRTQAVEEQIVDRARGRREISEPFGRDPVADAPAVIGDAVRRTNPRSHSRRTTTEAELLCVLVRCASSFTDPTSPPDRARSMNSWAALVPKRISSARVDVRAARTIARNAFRTRAGSPSVGLSAVIMRHRSGRRRARTTSACPCGMERRVTTGNVGNLAKQEVARPGRSVSPHLSEGMSGGPQMNLRNARADTILMAVRHETCGRHTFAAPSPMVASEGRDSAPIQFLRVPVARCFSFAPSAVLSSCSQMERVLAAPRPNGARLRCCLFSRCMGMPGSAAIDFSRLLWPDGDPEKVRHALTQSLYQIRRALSCDDLFVIAGSNIALNSERITTDVGRLIELVGARRSRRRRRDLSRSVPRWLRAAVGGGVRSMDVGRTQPIPAARVALARATRYGGGDGR